MDAHLVFKRVIGGVAFGGVVLSLTFVMPWDLMNAPSVAQSQDKPAVFEKDAALDLNSYLGAESCSGSACHNNVAPRGKLRIGQNEFFIWSQKDRHAKAYEVLTGPDSKRIAQNLKIDHPENSRRCLVCHGILVADSRQGKNFDITEGVSCEACHGPSEHWLGPHMRKDWDAKKAVTFGMYNTKDLSKRADKCLSCHLGVGEDVVDHELIGAGHPRLKFELDNYSHVMPPHWLLPKDKPSRDWLGTHAWAVNQAVALRNQVQLLVASRKTRSGLWPDFAHFDCYACHHAVVDYLGNLTDEEKKMQRWRTKDYGGKPGRLVWNAASYAVFHHVVRQASAEQAKTLDQLVKSFHEALTGKRAAADGFDSTLMRLSELTDQLVPKIVQHGFTPENVLSLMKNISGDGRAIGNLGFQSAEQAVFALASLYDAYSDAVGTMPEAKGIKEAIDLLYKDIKDGRTFDQAQFETDISRLNRYFSASATLPTPS